MTTIFNKSFSNLQAKSSSTFQEIYSRVTIDNFVKYIVQGIAVALAAYAIPNRKTNIREVAVVAIVAALTFFTLDIFTDDTSKAVKYGAGLGIGWNLVNLNTNIPYLSGLPF